MNLSPQNRQRRVCLITPPSLFLLDERVFINLGVLRVGSSLEAHGFKVDHLDLSGVSNFCDVVKTFLHSHPHQQIGITTTTPQLPLVVPIIQAIRTVAPDAKIILGGPHVTLTASAVKMEKKAGRISRAHKAFSQLQDLADVLVSGDGEFAIFKALEMKSGFIDADDPASGLLMSSEAYEKTEFPARHLVDMNSYHYQIDGRKATSLIGQLGCPFACGFCGGRNSNSLRRIRKRSVQSILHEVRMLYATYGFTGFMFYDDELNVSKELIPLMHGLTELQLQLGVEFRLRGFVKSELFTPDQAKAMYQAGFRWILSGFESGSPRILKNINKKATLADNSRTMDSATGAGLKVKALMSVGHPGESEITIRETQEWLLKVKPADFDCAVITTYPGTPYYDESVPHPEKPGVWTYTFQPTGDRLHAYEIDYLTTMDHYKGDPAAGYRSYVFTDFLSPEQIVTLRGWVEQSVREKLQIAYPTRGEVIKYEHSMGQTHLPLTILNQTKSL